MTTITRIVLFGIVLGCGVRPAAGQTSTPLPSREVITRSRIEASGIHRFSDLIAWIGTTTGTIEGLSWLFSIDELPVGPASRGGLPTPTILIDGLPVDINAHQGQFPELLPLAIQQIDSVEIIREPTLAGGRIGARGVIHFHTSIPPEGPGLLAWGRHGAETGDPGPYQYTPESTPNVQRSGPDGLVSVSYGRGRWDVEVTTRYVETAVDDSLLWAIHGERPSYTAYARGGSLRAGVEIAGRRQQLIFARHNDLGDAWIPSRGGIAHARLTSTHLGIAGGFPAGGATFNYHVASSTGQSSFSTTGVDEFARGSLDASAEVAVPVGRFIADVGAGLHRLTLDPVWSDDGPYRRTIPRVLARVRSTGVRSHASAAAEAAIVQGVIAPRLLAIIGRTSGIGTLSAALSYSSQPLEGVQGWEYALTFPDSARFDSRILRASVGLQRPLETLGAITELEGSAGVWRTREAALSGVAEPAGQRFLAFTAGLRTDRTGPVEGLVHYRGIFVRSIGEAGDAATPRAPTHQVTAHLSYRPADSFRLGVSTLLKSATTWGAADYALVGASEPRRINRVDLSAEKWFWRGRLRTQLAVANVLARSERYHPYGADFTLRYFVTVELVVR